VRALAGAGTLAALALATPASGAIVPQQGIKGAHLGDSVAKVRDGLGAPDKVIFTRDPIIGRVRVYRYGLTYVRFGGTTADATVTSIDTTSRAERTSRGIGVGSTRAQVAARVPGVECKVEFGLDHCYLGQFLAGRRVTDFRITSTGRVGRVVVGYVID
jgi:hypothetical protein